MDCIQKGTFQDYWVLKAIMKVTTTDIIITTITDMTMMTTITDIIITTTIMTTMTNLSNSMVKSF
jgi:hypothetical protein